MRKLFVLIIAISICLSMVACGSNGSETKGEEPTTETFYTDEAGAFVMTDDEGTTVSAKSLPCSITHNGANIAVNSVDVYRDQSTSNYAYTLYVVVEMDVSELDESQIHWLRETDLRDTVFLTDEKNEYDMEQMTKLGNLLLEDTKTIYFVFTTSEFKENRYDFSEAELRVFFKFTQEETYTDGDTERNKENFLSYNFTVPADPPSAETIPDPLYSYMAEWLGNRADFYGSLLG